MPFCILSVNESPLTSCDVGMLNNAGSCYIIGGFFVAKHHRPNIMRIVSMAHCSFFSAIEILMGLSFTFSKRIGTVS